MAALAKSIVIALDGTWQNPYRRKQRDDKTEVLKPSNVLKLCRSVPAVVPDSRVVQITYYSIGVGANIKYPGLANAVSAFAESRLGGAWGAGFESGIEAAFRFLLHNYVEGDRVYVFGFSRGASQARALTRFIDWLGGVPGKRDAYFVPLLFRYYLETRGRGKPSDVTTGGGAGLSDPLRSIDIALLAVWDTVMALGSRFRADADGATSARDRSFHVGSRPARCVRHAVQALAIDERRYDFRPEIWRAARAEQTLEQRWFCGTHAGVGGGYVHDGLANIPLRWVLGHGERLGLHIDKNMTKFYRAFPQDRLYSSYSSGFRLMERFRGRQGRGRRPLVGRSDSANLSLDPSVIHRLRSDPVEFERLDLYRPRNVLDFLRAQGDLDAYVASLGLDPNEPPTPQSLRVAIAAGRGGRGHSS